MTHATKRILTGGVVLGFAGCVISWILTSEMSPLYEYFLNNANLRNYWGLLNLPVLFVPLVFNFPDSRFFYFLLIFFQWFVIGVLLGFIGTGFSRLLSRL